MRGLDTNILVRYLLLDDPHQVEVVKNLFDQGTKREERYHVPSVVLCELVWVLRSVYRLGRDKICSTLGLILSVGSFEVQDRDLAERALEEYRTGQADFADYLIGRQNGRAGCDDTLSFDRDLMGHPGFTILR
ncbi:MAG: type II toxin-antitoxin system VapC family toxin [Acidobacteria bacterium]|nr:type II toxin-antitoxin system VapC family toxin [Acidobacteriota bacterium]